MEIATASTMTVKEVTERANDGEQNILSAPNVIETFEQLMQNVLASFAFTLENTAIDEDVETSPMASSPSESMKLVR